MDNPVLDRNLHTKCIIRIKSEKNLDDIRFKFPDIVYINLLLCLLCVPIRNLRKKKKKKVLSTIFLPKVFFLILFVFPPFFIV